MTSTAPARRAEEARLPWWTTGDWNGLFGLGTNVLLNVIVIAGLCLGVVGLADDTVYGRILPALAIALPLGNIWYAVLARRLARREGRADVTALPYGPVGAAHVHRRLRGDAAGAAAHGRPGPGLAGRAGLGVHHRRDRAVAGRSSARGSCGGRRGRRCWARSPASRSRSSPCARRRRCGRRRGSAWSRSRSSWSAGSVPGGCRRDAPVGLLSVCVATAVGWIAVLAGWSNILEPSAVSRVARAARAAPADPRRRGAARAARHRPAAGDRDSAGRLQLRRRHEQRRVGGRRGRPLPRPPGARRRRHRGDRRLVPRLPLPARRVHRPPRLEAGGRPDRVLAGDRDRRRPGVRHRPGRHLPGDLPHAGAGAGAALHRPGDRLAGEHHVGQAVRAGDRAGHAAQPRPVGHRPDRQRARRRRHHRRHAWGRTS